MCVVLDGGAGGLVWSRFSGLAEGGGATGRGQRLEPQCVGRG